MAYDVHLEIFEGPLDLLLYLIKKNDLEIAEIPIAQITTEYLRYLDMMKELNLEIAGEFLVMASTLMQIKARMLLPAPESEDEEENPLNELKARLLEYQKYKEVAQVLLQRETEFSGIYYRPAPMFDKDDFVLEVSLFQLMDGFRNVLRELPKDVKEIVYKEIPIEQRIREILDFLEGKPYALFTDILKQETTRKGLVVSFLAILELIRLKQIIVRQSQLFEEIRIYRVSEEAPVTADAEPPAQGVTPAELAGDSANAAAQGTIDPGVEVSTTAAPETADVPNAEPLLQSVTFAELPGDSTNTTMQGTTASGTEASESAAKETSNATDVEPSAQSVAPAELPGAAAQGAVDTGTEMPTKTTEETTEHGNS